MTGTVLVVGFGKSGEWATRLALSREIQVMVYDDVDLAAAGRLPKDLMHQSGFSLVGSDSLPDVDEVVISPGIPPEHPVVQLAEKRGLPVISEIAFAARFCGGRMIGITGSNGKTTVTECAAHLIRAGGLPGLACGNVGTPFSQTVLEHGPENIFVLELSSFQLERIRGFRPDVGALLNLSPDHLDRYPDVTAYYRAKIRLFETFGSGQVAVINDDDEAIRAFRDDIQGRVETVGRAGSLVRVSESGLFMADRRLCHSDDLMLKGMHNLYNAGFAAALASLAGVPVDAIVRGLRSFRPIPHRLELVGERNGVRFYNDSKATNFDSVVKALESFKRIRWIAGGKYKGGDFNVLSHAGRGRVQSAYFIGDSAARFHDALAGYWTCTKSDTLDQAVADAWRDAEAGDVVLLAPGCASFDQFRNFEERGDRFRERVQEVIGEADCR